MPPVRLGVRGGPNRRPAQRHRPWAVTGQAMRTGGRLRWRPPQNATDTAQPSDLEARVAVLEARVGELAGEARAAREKLFQNGIGPRAHNQAKVPPTKGNQPRS